MTDARPFAATFARSSADAPDHILRALGAPKPTSFPLLRSPHPSVLVAEVIAHFYPRLVELHNYSSANATTQKVYNWQTLNSRALKKLGFQIRRESSWTSATAAREPSNAC